MYLRQKSKLGGVAIVAAGALLASALPVSAQENQGDVGDAGAEIILDPDRDFPLEKLMLQDLSFTLSELGPGSALLVPLDPADVTDGPVDPTMQQEEGPPGKTLDELQDRMAAGPWSGTMALGGTVGAAETLRFTTNFAGTVELIVEDRVVSGGSYQMTGPMTISALRPEGGFVGNVQIQASGPVAGDDGTLSFQGAVESSGTATMVVTGVTEQTVPVPSQSFDVSWPIEMESYLCHEAYGDFAATFNTMLEGAGWTPELTGYVTLVQDNEEIRANIAEWRQAMKTVGPDANFEGVEVSEDLPEVVRLVTALLQNFNSLQGQIVAGEYDFQNLIDLMHDADYLLIQLRNLDTCEAQLLGEGVEEFRTLAQTAVFLLVDTFASGDATAEQFQAVTFAALNAGLLNRVVPPGLTGAPEKLANVASAIVRNHACGDEVVLSPSVYSAVATAAQMGWQLTLSKGQYNAGVLLMRIDQILAGDEPKFTTQAEVALADCRAALGGE